MIALITWGDEPELDNRQLEVFAIVAREGSFTKAAAELHLVQSAVSATIAALESDLGERLLDRTTRWVQPTAAGRALLPHAHGILDAFRAARDAVEAVGGGLSGSIRIGYMTNVTLVDVPQLLGRFAAAHPNVTMRLAPAATGTRGLAESLQSGDIDLAFLSATAPDYPMLRIDSLATSRLGLAVSASDPLAGRASIPLADTVGLRFVDSGPGFANRALVDAEFRRRGLRRDVQIETADMHDSAALVRYGLCVGFLPQYLVEKDDQIRWIAVEDAEFVMHVSVGTARDRTLSAAAARLADMARAEQA
jgi:DNA-binding transcriptional LysR family regulator